MSLKKLAVVFYHRDWVDSAWQYEFPGQQLSELLGRMRIEFAALGIELCSSDEDFPIQIRGYGDLLNSIRLRFPSANLGNLCLGHVIGSSRNCDLIEDLRRGINRVAFAPETVEPDGSDKVVCHNCGCGC